VTSRERVRRAITFTGPDRAPINHAVFPGAYHRHGTALVQVLDQYPDDFGNRPVLHAAPARESDGYLEEYRDAWGSVWVRVLGYTAGEVKRPALPTWDAFAGYQFPPPTPQQQFDDLKAQLKASHDHWSNGSGGALFEQLQWLRGPENLYIDLAEDREELHVLADRLVDYFLDHITRYLQAGVDGISFSDDWGSQHALLISPRQWRTFFKPRYRRMFEPIKDAGKYVFFHTDGWTLDILADLVEIGVDVLNPQHTLMGEEELSGRFGGRVCFRSDLDRQRIIPHGTPAEITEHVQRVIAAFGRFHGGLILHGEIGPDVPLENVMAMYAAFREYGQYPLRWL
jgi:uroporphyrinogen decarboxylase